ncbi:class I SAM-dependent methyltransferase, partial [Patescibacteria group bacterium]|nr:class I SAM-dependent methyltransferase [Patescibacteria group bacterium]
MKSQTIKNIKGEIEFRKKLAKQHVTGEMLLPDYYGKEAHDKILFERVDATLNDIKPFEKQIRLSPFVELGAERCQRSLVLTNDFNAIGFAVDISYHQLKTAEHFAKMFDRPKLPYRICCDINNLPFRSNSFPFVFCYEFLHHFSSPKPIMQEVYRILSNGTFFFGKEPYKKPKVVLYKQNCKIYSKSAIQKNKVRRFIEGFFSEKYCDEREHGIMENEDISLRDWIDALSVFDTKKVSISSLENRIKTKLGNRIAVKNIVNMLLGGEIKGVCEKEEHNPERIMSDLTNLLLCPNCITNLKYPRIDQPQLTQTANSLE